MELAQRIILWMLVLQLVYIIVCKWFDPPITLTQLGSVVTGDNLHRDYITYDEMGPNIKLAVMAGKTSYFPIITDLI